MKIAVILHTQRVDTSNESESAQRTVTVVAVCTLTALLHHTGTTK